MNGLRLRAAGAGRQCAPAALIGRFRAAPQLHRWASRERPADISLFARLLGNVVWCTLCAARALELERTFERP